MLYDSKIIASIFAGIFITVLGGAPCLQAMVPHVLIQNRSQKKFWVVCENQKFELAHDDARCISINWLWDAQRLNANSNIEFYDVDDAYHEFCKKYKCCSFILYSIINKIERKFNCKVTLERKRPELSVLKDFNKELWGREVLQFIISENIAESHVDFYE